MDVLSFEVNENDINKHEEVLKEYGAIKIQTNINWKLSLKKKGKISFKSSSINKQIIKKNNNQLIYFLENLINRNENYQDYFKIEDENNFCSLLSFSPLNKEYPLNISILPNKSFFSKKISRNSFSMYRLLN